MTNALLSLFQSRTREALVRRLFGEGEEGTVSELARRCGVTPRALGLEVQNLESVGLVQVEAVGNTDMVRPKMKHPLAKALKALVLAAVKEPLASDSVRASLAAYGAPLTGDPGHANGR